MWPSSCYLPLKDQNELENCYLPSINLKENLFNPSDHAIPLSEIDKKLFEGRATVEALKCLLEQYQIKLYDFSK